MFTASLAVAKSPPSRSLVWLRGGGRRSEGAEALALLAVRPGGVWSFEGGRRGVARGDGGCFFVESRFVEAAEVAGAAAGVEDGDEAAEGVEDGGGAGVVGGDGGEVEAEAFHDGMLLSFGGAKIGSGLGNPSASASAGSWPHRGISLRKGRGCE